MPGSEEITRLKDARDVDALLALLGDPAFLVRERAALALGEIGETRAVAPLIALLRSRDPASEEVAAALGMLSDPAAIDVLLEALGDRDDHVMRDAAAAALGAFDEPRVIEALGLVVTEGSMVVTRAVAARALGDIGGSASSQALLPALSDPDGMNRGHIALALGAAGDRRAVEPLAQALAHEDDRSAARAVRRGRPRQRALQGSARPLPAGASRLLRCGWSVRSWQSKRSGPGAEWRSGRGPDGVRRRRRRGPRRRRQQALRTASRRWPDRWSGCGC
jgi:HEAT repeat protein